MYSIIYVSYSISLLNRNQIITIHPYSVMTTWWKHSSLHQEKKQKNQTKNAGPPWIMGNDAGFTTYRMWRETCRMQRKRVRIRREEMKVGKCMIQEAGRGTLENFFKRTTGSLRALMSALNIEAFSGTDIDRIIKEGSEYKLIIAFGHASVDPSTCWTSEEIFSCTIRDAVVARVIYFSCCEADCDKRCQSSSVGQPVGCISGGKGGRAVGGGELRWGSLLCCSWPRVKSKCVRVTERWKGRSMNKADPVNYSEKWFWAPWGEREGLLCVYKFVCVCLCVLLRPLTWTEVALESYSDIKTWHFQRAEGIDQKLSV